MMLQYTAASLAMENTTLAMPDSVLSLPTSGDQEDVNANSTTAARRLTEMVENLSSLVAISFLTAAQGLDLRMRSESGQSPGPTIASIHAEIRHHVPYSPVDHPFSTEIETVKGLMKTGRLLQAAHDSQR
jgi:histidine ammonia-lyase